jgi:hypothetical protein
VGDVGASRASSCAPHRVRRAAAAARGRRRARGWLLPRARPRRRGRSVARRSRPRSRGCRRPPGPRREGRSPWPRAARCWPWRPAPVHEDVRVVIARRSSRWARCPQRGAGASLRQRRGRPRPPAR